VLPNAVDLAGLPTGKSPEAARTVAMVGWSSASKDPLFALDVLAALRRRDPSWRLLLIGGDFPASLRTRSRAYKEAVEERLRTDPDLQGGVERLGHVTSVARPEVGFVLSSSLRESFHVGLMQAAASGAVPVVRDWPTLRRLGGAAAVVPAEWVVPDLEGAVERILAHADPGVRQRAGEQARRAVVARYDWASCADGYDALLLT
jgi:glycosyltransferase involved in cell wall biosynthesis